MVDRKGEVRAQSQGKTVTLLKKHKTIEVLVVDNADTITVDGLTTIDNAKVVNLADGADVTVTILTNVITINDIGVTNAHVLCQVVGI